MITQEQINIARKQFVHASEMLGFTMVSPFVLDEDTNLAAFVFLPDYGSINGAMIDLTESPEFKCASKIIEWCKSHQVFYSCLNIEPLLGAYDEQYFKELLRDWKL